MKENVRGDLCATVERYQCLFTIIYFYFVFIYLFIFILFLFIYLFLLSFIIKLLLFLE